MTNTPATTLKTSYKQVGKIVLAFIIAIGIGAFFYFDFSQYLSLSTIKANRDNLLTYTEENFWPSVVVFVFLYIAQTAFSLPGGALMTLSGGFLFGSLLGTIFVNLGATVGATLAFLAARYLLQDWVEEKFGKRLETIQAGFAKNAFSYLVTLRLIPVFPFFLVNLVSGLTRVKLGTYVVATSIGIIPGSFVYAFAGRQLGTINSLREIASPPVLLAFTLLGFFVLVPIIYRELSRKQET